MEHALLEKKKNLVICLLYWLLSRWLDNKQMNQIVKYQGFFFKITRYVCRQAFPLFPPRSISFCPCSNYHAITWLEMLATQVDAWFSFSTCCALKLEKGDILISEYCNTESVLRLTVWLHKGPSIFNFGVFFIFNFMGLIGLQTGTHNFSQNEYQDSP